jgi:hypothetical protein
MNKVILYTLSVIIGFHTSSALAAPFHFVCSEALNAQGPYKSGISKGISFVGDMDPDRTNPKLSNLKILVKNNSKILVSFDSSSVMGGGEEKCFEADQHGSVTLPNGAKQRLAHLLGFCKFQFTLDDLISELKGITFPLGVATPLSLVTYVVKEDVHGHITDYFDADYIPFTCSEAQ